MIYNQSPFSNTNSALFSYTQSIIQVPKAKSSRINYLVNLPKKALLQAASKNLSDTLYILQNQSLVQKLAPAELLALVRVHPFVIQQIAKKEELRDLLPKEDLLRLCQNDPLSAKYIFVLDNHNFRTFEDPNRANFWTLIAETNEALAVDVLNHWDADRVLTAKHLVQIGKNRPKIASCILESKKLSQKLSEQDRVALSQTQANESKSSTWLLDRKQCNQFAETLSKRIKKVEAKALIQSVVEVAKFEESHEEALALLLNDPSQSEQVKHIICCKLSNEEIELFIKALSNNPRFNPWKEFAGKVLYTRSIRHQTDAPFIAHVIDYLHRTSPQRIDFTFSAEEVAQIIKSAVSKKKPNLATVQGKVQQLARDLLSDIAIDEALLPKSEVEDLREYLKQKNRQHGSPQAISLARYFQEGDSKNFKRLMYSQRPVLSAAEQGPQRKNKYTQQLEYIIEHYLRNLDQPIAISKKNDTYFLEMNGVTFDLSKIVKYANLNHLHLDSQSDRLYQDYIRGCGIYGNLPYPLPQVRAQLTSNTLFNMPLGGMTAINIYTGNGGFTSINPLLRFGPRSTNVDAIMLPLLTAAFASHALNQARESKKKPVFRCLTEPHNSEIKTDWKQLAATQAVSKEAFLSTCVGYPLKDSAYKHFVFCETTAPCIRLLSKCSSEREVLIPPSLFRWTHHQQDQNGHHYYMVQEASGLEHLAREEHEGLFDGDVNAQDESGNTPLHFAIMMQPELATEMIKSGADLMKANDNGVTACHLIALHGNESMIRAYLTTERHLTAKDKYGKTPWDTLKTRSLTPEFKSQLERLAGIVAEPPPSPAAKPTPIPTDARVQKKQTSSSWFSPLKILVQKVRVLWRSFTALIAAWSR